MRRDPAWSDEDAIARLTRDASVDAPSHDPIAPNSSIERLVPDIYCTGDGRVVPSAAVQRLKAQSSVGPSTGAQLSASSANTYQTDSAALYSGNGDWRSSSWKVYVQNPTTATEFNQCDSSSSSSTCVWFAGTQFDVGSSSSTYCGIHIGPLRGADSGSVNWRTNFGFYCNNTAYPYFGVNVPTGQWVGYLMDRTATGMYLGLPVSSWRIYSYWNGIPTIEGDVTLWGDRMRSAYQWVELIEADGPCSTDLPAVHFNDARYYNASGGPYTFSSAIARYESTCGNTSWGRWAYNDDWIVDVRNTTRSIGADAQLWSIP